MLCVSAVIGLETPRARKKAIKAPTSRVSAAMISWILTVVAIELSGRISRLAESLLQLSARFCDRDLHLLDRRRDLVDL
jgi:hypothetical protein